MGTLATWAARLVGWDSARELDAACQAPAAAQMRALRRILRRNASTAFARDHGLTGGEDAREFRRKVPVRDFEGHRPYVDRATRGEYGVLTADPPVFFARTSGTTAEPKLIPVTAAGAAADARLMRQWVHRAWGDHKDFLRGDIFTVVSPAVEEHSPGGVAVGSASGFIASRIPSLVRRSYAVPPEMAGIQEYRLRYLTMVRLSLGRRITHLNTPNPSTLARLAELAAAQGPALVRAVRDGRLIPAEDGGSALEAAAGGDAVVLRALRRLEKALRPDPALAARLEGFMKSGDRGGRLLPKDFWPDLRLIGCWTGGSVGDTAARLKEWYGNVPVRDLGYVASEGRFTVPVSDGTAAGLPALEDKYFEFLPEDAGDGEAALGIEDLEEGRSYRILVTTPAGLYRYDIQDVVRVEGFRGRTPLLAFARKGKDMASITGEKLHANQVLAAFSALASQTARAGLVRSAPKAFRAAADASAARYRFYLEPSAAGDAVDWDGAWVRALDLGLQQQNLEYKQKRESGRLAAPCLHVMAEGWSEGLFQAWLRSGRKDAQYKWQVLVQSPDPAFAAHSVRTVEADG